MIRRFAFAALAVMAVLGTLAPTSAQASDSEKPPSLFGGFEAGDRSYMGFGLSWINPDGTLNGVPFESTFGDGLGFVMYGGRELRRGLAIQVSVGLDAYADDPADNGTFWSTLGLRLQPIEWTLSPYIYGGAGMAGIVMDAPNRWTAGGTVFNGVPPWWQGDVDAELAFTTDAGGGVEILLLDDLAFAVEFRYRYQNGLSSYTGTHQFGIGGNFVLIGD